ncbi:hypothetical protein [Kitasatospora sp. NPDC059827]
MPEFGGGFTDPDEPTDEPTDDQPEDLADEPPTEEAPTPND